MVRVRYSFGSRHTGRIANIKKQRGKYPDVMREVVRISDIVLEILDARYVEETRNLEVEADVIRQGKKLLFVLNKVDLVDVKDVKLPKDLRPFVFVSATKGRGAKDLKGKIKMEAKRILKEFSRGVGVGGMGVSDGKGKGKFSKIKDKEKRDELARAEKGRVVKGVRGGRRVHVGVIGYPNAGKSSVINMITRRGVAKTAKQAGFTKGMQKIRMSEGILILDTPGVIPESKYSSEVGSFAKDVKVGARTYSDVKNPEDVVFFLMKENEGGGSWVVGGGKGKGKGSAGDKIERFYGIDAKGDVDKLIEELGRKKGFLGKGGIVDVDRTARIILRDWQEGKVGR